MKRPWKDAERGIDLTRIDQQKQLFRYMDHIIDALVCLKHTRFNGLQPTPGREIENRGLFAEVMANILRSSHLFVHYSWEQNERKTKKNDKCK